MGIDPGHLITCSFMAAPCALAVSKLFYPETEESQTTIENIVVEKGDESNVLDAAAKVEHDKVHFESNSLLHREPLQLSCWS